MPRGESYSTDSESWEDAVAFWSPPSSDSDSVSDTFLFSISNTVRVKMK